jgi:hypothetical protein
MSLRVCSSSFWLGLFLLDEDDGGSTRRAHCQEQAIMSHHVHAVASPLRCLYRTGFNTYMGSLFWGAR